MAKAREVPAFRTELFVSRRFVCLLSAAHAGALAIAVSLSFSRLWLVPLCVAVMGSWFWTLRRHALLRSAASFVELEIEGERSCALQRRRGDWLRGELRASSYVLPWLIVLDVAGGNRLFGTRVVLFPDSMAPDQHRRLRVRLRWARYVDADPDSADASL